MFIVFFLSLGIMATLNDTNLIYQFILSWTCLENQMFGGLVGIYICKWEM